MAWTRLGDTPYLKVPIKASNTSLLAAISLDKKPFYQIFEGGIKANDFQGFIINLIQLYFILYYNTNRARN